MSSPGEKVTLATLPLERNYCLGSFYILSGFLGLIWLRTPYTFFCIAFLHSPLHVVMFGATAGLLGVSLLLTQVNGLTAALGRLFALIELLVL